MIINNELSNRAREILGGLADMRRRISRRLEGYRDNPLGEISDEWEYVRNNPFRTLAGMFFPSLPESMRGILPASIGIGIWVAKTKKMKGFFLISIYYYLLTGGILPTLLGLIPAAWSAFSTFSVNLAWKIWFWAPIFGSMILNGIKVAIGFVITKILQAIIWAVTGILSLKGIKLVFWGIGVALFAMLAVFRSNARKTDENITRELSSAQARHFAEGGFPAHNAPFIAREAGPELVGTIGGRTAVANNDQIVESVSRGVYESFMSALMRKNADVSISAKVYLDGRLMATA